MLWTPQKGRTTIITNGGIVGTPFGTNVSSNAVTLLDGAVTELIPAANNVQESWGIFICVNQTNVVATAGEATLDILIGGATDDVLIESLIVGYTLAYGSRQFFFPIHIPQGVRIAATLASARITSITARVFIQLYGGEPPPFRVGRKVTTYGTKVNNARGQAVVPAESGATATVTEMTASTSEDHFAFLLGFQPATDTTIAAVGTMNIGIGVGASTEERIGTWWFTKNTDESMNGPIPEFPVFQDVPSGSRLSILASNSGTNDAAYDGLIYAVS